MKNRLEIQTGQTVQGFHLKLKDQHVHYSVTFILSWIRNLIFKEYNYSVTLSVILTA